MNMPPAPADRPDRVLPTLASTAAAATHWHCIVIGAGPSGTAVAIRLARHGLRVLLVDRTEMPRPKVCGCCLSSLAVAELERLCLPAYLPTPLPLATVRVVSAGRSSRVPMPSGGALSREALDTALVRAAIAAGADWLPHTLVMAVHESIDGHGAETASVTVRAVAPAAAETACLRADVVVIAAGLADTIRIVPAADPSGPAETAPHRSMLPMRERRVDVHSRIGLGTTLAGTGLGPDVIDLPAGELVMAVGRHGYCGVVRLEDGRIDVAAAVDRRLLADAGDPATALVRLLHEAAGGPARNRIAWAPLLQALSTAACAATPPLTHCSPLVDGALKRVFRVGDAAGYVEPFTGEGIGWALASGRVLAESLLAKSLAESLLAPERHGWHVDTASAAARYRQLHAGIFTRHHARCLRIARGIRHPAIVSWAVGLANLMPWAARRAVPLLVGAVFPSTKRSVMTAMTALPGD